MASPPSVLLNSLEILPRVSDVLFSPGQIVYLAESQYRDDGHNLVVKGSWSLGSFQRTYETLNGLSIPATGSSQQFFVLVCGTELCET